MLKKTPESVKNPHKEKIAWDFQRTKKVEKDAPSQKIKEVGQKITQTAKIVGETVGGITTNAVEMVRLNEVSQKVAAHLEMIETVLSGMDNTLRDLEKRVATLEKAAQQ